jgi:hypothetical protein
MLPWTASAGNSAGEQDALNLLLEEGGYIELEDREYILTGPLFIYSNTVLTGGPHTVLKVECPNGKWFSNTIGVLNSDTKGYVDNVSISGFEIDGNVQNLPKAWHQSRSDTAHDCEALIRIIGSSGRFSNNIRIFNMNLHDSFSDGLTIRFCNNAQVYNNEISNCQHEGVFLTCCIDSVIFGCRDAGITSDCLRLDNCVRCKVYDNILFSYGGPNADNTYMHGENGIQIGDAGVSKGYDGRNKPTTTQDIEVYNNTIINVGLSPVLLDSRARDPAANVYVHDNEIIGKKDLETRGTSFDIDLLNYINGNYSYENMPTVEDNKNVFNELDNILNMKFYKDGYTNQDPEDLPIRVTMEEKGLLTGGIKVIILNTVNINDKVYVPDNKSFYAQSKVILSPLYAVHVLGSTRTSKTENIELKDGKIFASLSVKLTQTTTKTINGVTRRTTRTLQRTTFTADPIPYPEVLELPPNLLIKLDTYRGANNYTILTLPENVEGLQRIEISCNGSTVERFYLIGERSEDEAGVISTNFSTLRMWAGDIPHVGDEARIEGDLDKKDLKIKAYSVYGEIPVTTQETEHTFTGEQTDQYTIIALLKLFVVCLCGYKIIRLKI